MRHSLLKAERPRCAPAQAECLMRSRPRRSLQWVQCRVNRLSSAVAVSHCRTATAICRSRSGRDGSEQGHPMVDPLPPTYGNVGTSNRQHCDPALPALNRFAKTISWLGFRACPGTTGLHVVRNVELWPQKPKEIAVIQGLSHCNNWRFSIAPMMDGSDWREKWRCSAVFHA